MSEAVTRILASINKLPIVGSVRPIHGLLLTSGLVHHRLLIAELAKSCALSNNLPYAFGILSRVLLHHRTPFLLNTLLTRLSTSHAPNLVLPLYKHLTAIGFAPDAYTFPLLFKSCTKFSGLAEGRQLHVIVLKTGFLSSDIFTENALMHLYGVCYRVEDAMRVFDEMPQRDVVSWTALIAAYVNAGFFSVALRLFSDMDAKPNEATMVTVFVACGRLGDVSFGRKIHGVITKRREGMSLVTQNALLDMYVKCCCLGDARQVFKLLSRRDVISWTSFITGLAQCGLAKEALEVFHDMQTSSVEPDKVTLTSVLSACASLGALQLGRWVHNYIERKGIEWDVHITTSVIDMYARGGCMDAALEVFNRMPSRKLQSWNALLRGLAMHGRGRLALNYYKQMVSMGFVPNEITFLAVLSACSHSGLVEEGRVIFRSMPAVYDIILRVEHYGCMVDLLGRAGFLEESYDLIQAMPMESDLHIWGSILSAYKSSLTCEISQRIQKNILGTKGQSDSGIHVLLSNIYATKGRWEDATQMRELMKKLGVKKEPGSSVIDVDGKPREFLVDGWDHPEKDSIRTVLKSLANHMQLV